MLGGPSQCDLLLALLSEPLNFDAGGVSFEVALDLDYLGNGAFDAFPLFFGFGLLNVGFKRGSESVA